MWIYRAVLQIGTFLGRMVKLNQITWADYPLLIFILEGNGSQSIFQFPRNIFNMSFPNTIDKIQTCRVALT
jgi:hypothetical protein